MSQKVSIPHRHDSIIRLQRQDKRIIVIITEFDLFLVLDLVAAFELECLMHRPNARLHNILHVFKVTVEVGRHTRFYKFVLFLDLESVIYAISDLEHLLHRAGDVRHRWSDIDTMSFLVYEFVGVLGLLLINELFVALAHQCLKLNKLTVGINDLCSGFRLLVFLLLT